MIKSLLSISQLENVTKPRILGYFVASTAPINVEGDDLPAHKQQVQASQQLPPDREELNLHQIAEQLYQKVTDPFRSELNSVELIISANGFSNSIEATKKRFEEIYEYINKDNSHPFQSRANSLMYIGFRWPSEPLVGDNSWWWEKAYHAIAALPILPRTILFFGTLGILLSLVFHEHKPWFNNILSLIFSILILILTTSFFFVVTLVVLRLLIYFRDYYRASNFGVPDLVELIRQLDKALVTQVKEQYIHHIRLIGKLKILLLQKIKDKLASERTNVTQQEEIVIEAICDRMVNDYCKDRSIEVIKVEDLDMQAPKEFIEQAYVDRIAKLVEKILKEDKEVQFVKIKERAIEILENKAKRYWQDKNRIRLTFIGHSMGGYVVTSAIRILSDVFDLNSVGTLELNHKLPTSNIGRVFRLERLVLVAPDIPINTILSGRSNFLRSSLRRFAETYLFSNEGDLALRLASTLANYFSFPARTRESGYRLGNVAIRDERGYGIVNLHKIQQQHHKDLLKTLFVDSFNQHKSLAKIQENFQVDEMEDPEEIAKLFTYFDFTDYTDETRESNSKKRRILSLRKWQLEPRWVYYIRLTIAYSLGKIDTHGGYFQGQFSQQAMYRLAFLGFGGFLDAFDRDSRTSALDSLSQTCRQNKVQVVLSQERYEVDIIGCDREQVRREMLNA